MPTILSKYKLKNNYNADESGLFCQALPNKSLHYKDENCSNGKHSNVRLTGLAAGNAIGEKLPFFVIGKSAKPRCFSGAKKFTLTLSFSRKELDRWGFVYKSGEET